MCIFPSYRTITDKYTKKPKLVQTSCGRCPDCLKKSRQEWYTRNLIESYSCDNAYFVTLTYNDENLPHSEVNNKPCFSKRDIQLFLKRLRKYITSHYKSCRLRYFLVSEYGGKFGRPHYHAIFYNLPFEPIEKLNEIISQTWNNGFASVGPLTPAGINYTCKYMLQRVQSRHSFSDEALAPFLLASRKPAIGSSYLESVDNHHYHLLNETYETTLFGEKIFLPRYLRDKIFSDYPDIKEKITEKFINEKIKQHEAIEHSKGHHHLYKSICKSNKDAIRRYYRYRKEQFGQEQGIEHLEIYLKNH